MTSRAAVLACLLASAAWPLAARQTPSPLVYRTGTRTVPVYATVQDGDRLVTDLPQDAFDVRDNGRPQPITLFDNGVQPISIVVMLDLSGSMLGNLTLVRNAAVQMFTRLLPADRARVGSFGEQITISPTFTNDQDELIRALWLDLPAGGGTPLYAAIDQAMTALARVEGRRVVLVLSDGKDSGRRGAIDAGRMPATLHDVMLRAQEQEFMIYAIGMPSRSTARAARSGLPPAGSEPDPGLRVLAAESGGGYIEIDHTSALGPAFARVADELHRQYLVGYALPEADGRKHDIEVRVDRPGLTVRARKSYFAPRPQR
jgi:Ca-activated chloride channel family protein